MKLQTAPLLGIAVLCLTGAWVCLLLLLGADLVWPSMAVGMIVGLGVTAGLALLAEGKV